MTCMYDIGGGARKMISDLDGSLGFRNFLLVVNETTTFASWASVFESSKLVTSLKWTSDQKVACAGFCRIWMEIRGGCEKIAPVSESSDIVLTIGAIILS